MSAWPPSGHVPELPPAARPPAMPAAPALRPPPPPATPAPPAPTRPAPPTPGKCPWRLSIGTPLWSEGAIEADPTGLRCACVRVLCACVHLCNPSTPRGNSLARGYQRLELLRFLSSQSAIPGKTHWASAARLQEENAQRELSMIDCLSCARR